MKLLFYSFCPPEDPSTVHRCYLIARELDKHGIQADVWAGSFARSLTEGLIYAMANLHKYDAICFHRHGSLPAYLLMRMAKRLGKIVLLDFDDALWVFDRPDVRSNHKSLNRWLGYPMLPKMIAGSDAVITGSHYLMHYALKYNTNSYLIPTAIDTDIFKPVPQKISNRYTIGWLGNGPNHMENLRLLASPLAALAHRYPIKLRIISALGNRELMGMFPNGSNYKVDYGLNTMVDMKLVPGLISDFGISVCPLLDNSFFNGTCACKMLSSMAMGIPVVASPVGEHNHIVKDGVNGFLAADAIQWIHKIATLIENDSLRRTMGDYGLETVKHSYTLGECARQFAEVCLNG